jgi:hypothetical protein
MQQILEIVGVLVVLLLVLRFSLRRRSAEIALRGGLTGLNVVTGLLLGMSSAVTLSRFLPPNGLAAPLDGMLARSGYSPLAGALLAILPFAGAAFGGMLGYLLLGGLWRRLLVNGSASARAWLRRSQFTICVAALALIIVRLRGW